MKILAINGSHRKGKNTAKMLSIVLDSAKSCGASTELLELTDYNINFCKSCNACLAEPKCSIKDDMAVIGKKLIEADGIVVGSPVYWMNVTAVMKNFIDRTRWMHMRENLLEGKVGAAVTHAGLRNGGQEVTLQILEHFLQGHDLFIVNGRGAKEPIFNCGAMGTMSKIFSDGKLKYYKSVLEDEVTVHICKQMGINMVNLIKRLTIA